MLSLRKIKKLKAGGFNRKFDKKKHANISVTFVDDAHPLLSPSFYRKWIKDMMHPVDDELRVPAADIFGRLQQMMQGGIPSGKVMVITAPGRHDRYESIRDFLTKALAERKETKSEITLHVTKKRLEEGAPFEHTFSDLEDMPSDENGRFRLWPAPMEIDPSDPLTSDDTVSVEVNYDYDQALAEALKPGRVQTFSNLRLQDDGSVVADVSLEKFDAKSEEDKENQIRDVPEA